ncbi:hypothetical protein [Caproicibacter fermentans]|uniref:hypothetical protein n=1 Tax=Caproicibacter fermentans TaxID=2576756 RepID=UPI0038B2DFFD
MQREKASLFVANTSVDKSYLISENLSSSFLLSSEISSDQFVKIAESMKKK